MPFVLLAYLITKVTKKLGGFEKRNMSYFQMTNLCHPISFLKLIYFCGLTMQFTNNEKMDMIFVYARCLRNSVNAVELYADLYPGRRAPNPRTFANLERNLREHGSFQKPRKRAETVTLEGGENEINVLGNNFIFVLKRCFNSNCCLGYVNYKNNNNEEVSLREIEDNTGVTKFSAKKILRRHKFKNYRCRKIHHLRHTDLIGRRIFCRWIIRKTRQERSFCKKILWSDESRFCNNGWFNRNIHYRWTQENQHYRRETAFQERFGINVWLGILDTKVVGPIFFDQHLTGEMYLNLLQNELQELLDELPLDTLANFEYFQQDGAPAHRDRRCIRFLNEFKPNKWIGNHGPVHWPARSPDLTPMDFSIWGH